MSSIKRLYFYFVAFVALIVVANGATTMLGPILDRLLPNRLLLGSLATPFSLGLAMIIPGLPLWLIHWRATQRYVRRDPEEIGSAERKLYLNALLFISAVVVLLAALRIFGWFLGAEDARMDGSSLASLLVWGSLWSYHWRVESSEGQPTPDARRAHRLYLYLTSAYSLVTLVVGLGVVLAVLLSGIYNALFPGVILDAPAAWGDQMRMGVSLIAMGGLWWGFHWVYAARGDRESVLGQVYLYLFAVLGGIVTVLSAIIALIYQTLWFILGGVDASASSHFEFVVFTLTFLLWGVALFVYHWRVVQEEGTGMPLRLLGAGRGYRYIMTGLGLASFSGGMITLVFVLLGFLVALSPGIFLGNNWWQNPLSAALAMLVVGMPVWFYFWTTAQSSALQGSPEERAILPRRLFLYVVLGAAMLGMLGNLTFLLFKFINGIIEGTLSLDVLRETRWSIGVVITAGVFLGYYWSILREDQRVGAEAAPRRKEVTLVVGEWAAALVPELEEVLGTRPKVLYNLSSDEASPSLSQEELQDLAGRVAAAPGGKVLLVVTEGTVIVYPYR